ncbi:hypothetical protein E1I69_19160 [Bacillus timonensis]|uniref:Lipoprotein n=1 Tax=Bacillus timonensis TaxID=1033734 RepID=A0A4S3PML6_9BACI|nr:hypothetical protein [Bacillus timonensis]THE10335.1 hypothetical protein E1I69_19160 [Bacillus timonensis]
MYRFNWLFLLSGFVFMILSGCSNDNLSEKEESPKAPATKQEQQAIKIDPNAIIKESGIESYIPSDAQNAEIEVVSLTGKNQPEVLVAYSLNDENTSLQSKIVVSQYNPSFKEWEIILNEEEVGEYHYIEPIGRLSVFDNKLEQPVFRLNAGGSGSPDWVAVLLYDKDSKDFYFKRLAAEHVYSGISVLDDKKTIEFDGVTLKERFTWKTNDFDHRTLLKNPKIDGEVTHTIRYSFRDNMDYESTYTSNVENNSVIPAKIGDTIALIREDIGEDLDVYFAGEGLKEISPFYYEVADLDKDCTITFRTESSDWITYSFVSE